MRLSWVAASAMQFVGCHMPHADCKGEFRREILDLTADGGFYLII